jgi:hypothetical protein
VGTWKTYQNRLPSELEISTWFANAHDALCLVCGKVSGNLEVIDFDHAGELFSAWKEKIDSELYAKLVVEKTPSGGYHVAYRCEGEICGNIKLAQGIREEGKLVTLIETRGEGGLFLCAPSEGAAMLVVGDCTHGYTGGGFLYTNKDSISLGLVATIEHLQEADTTIYQMMDDFKKHPAVAPIIRDAAMVEHSGHMVSEGGFDMIPEYVHDGCLVAGDAAMLCMNLGYQVRGMDLAISSGRFAAEAACAAIDAGDVSAAGMAGYRSAMEESFVIKDLKTYRKWPQTMDKWSRMFTEYPTMVREALNAVFVVDGEPGIPLRKRLWPIVKKRGVFKLIKEVGGALRAL